MSGHPNVYANDSANFRQDYMANLMAQVNVDAMNLQANQVYKATGQLPPQSSMPDTRTTTEKLADRVRLKVDIVNELKPIAGANFASIVIQEIENSKLNTEGKFFEYFAQNIKEIVANLKKKYSYGIKGDENDAEAFRSFVEDAYNTSNSLKGTIKGSINRPSSSRSGIDKSGMDYFIKQMKHIHAMIAGRHGVPGLEQNIIRIEEKSKILSEFLASDAVLESLRNVFIENSDRMDEIQVYIDRKNGNFQARSIYSDVENYKKHLPNIETLLTLLSQFQKYIDNNRNDATAVRYLVNIESLLADTYYTELLSNRIKLFIECSKMVEEPNMAEQIIDTVANTATALSIAAAGTLGAMAAVEGMEGFTDYGEGAYNAIMMAGANAGAEVATKAPQFLPSNLAKAGVAGLAFFGNMANPQGPSQGPGGVVSSIGYQNISMQPGPYDYFQPQPYNYAGMSQSDLYSQLGLPQQPYNYASMGQSNYLQQDDNEQIPGLETDLTTPENVSDIEKIGRMLIRLRDATTEAGRAKIESAIKKVKDAWATRNGSDYDTDVQQKANGQGLKRGRGRPKGSGIVRPFKDKVDLDRGIAPDRRFIKFGRFLINTNKLKDDVVAIKRPSGSNIVEFPSQRVSPHLSHVFKRIIGGGVPSFNELSKLNETERNYLYNVSKKAEIVDKLSIPTPSKDQKDQDIHEYEVMKGEILSGNDNKELIKKFKIHMSKLSRQGVLPKKEVNEILTDLLELGH